MKTSELVMSLAGTGLQIYICVLLVLRGLQRQFRFFTLSLFLSVLSTITLIMVRNHAVLYRDIYWPSEAVSMVVTFLALQEAFYLVFRNFLSISGFRLLFPGIGVVMLIIAAIRTAFKPALEASFLSSILISLEIGVGFLQFGIFCLFIVLVRFFHMRWRQRAFGVVLGFGVAAAGSLVVYLLRSEFGTKFEPVVRVTPPIAYIIGVVVWLVTFLWHEPLQPPLVGSAIFSPEQMATDLRRYTHAVKGILER